MPAESWCCLQVAPAGNVDKTFGGQISLAAAGGTVVPIAVLDPISGLVPGGEALVLVPPVVLPVAEPCDHPH